MLECSLGQRSGLFLSSGGGGVARSALDVNEGPLARERLECTGRSLKAYVCEGRSVPAANWTPVIRSMMSYSEMSSWTEGERAGIV